MAKKNNINNSALAKLCSYVVLASQQQGILDNLNIADDKTYSSKHIKDLIDNISEEDRKYAEKLVKNLNSLSSKKIDEQPTDLNTQPNTMYFWNENGDGTTFKQYLRLDDELLYLGSTADINLDGYLLESDADDKFETIANVQLIKDVLGDTTQLETSTIMGDLEKAKESDGLIPVTKAQHNELVTNGSTTINGKVVTYDANAFYVITDDENSVVDMSQYLTTADKVNMGIYAGDLNNVVVDKIDNVYVFGVSPSECTNLPINDYGMLEVMYITSNNFCIQRFTSITNEIYTRNKVSGNWNAWQKVCTTKVADVPTTPIVSEDTDVTMNSDCIYTVINGICYVTLWGFQSTATGQHVICRSLPKPKVTIQSMCCYGSNGNTGACIFIHGNENNGKLYAEINTTGQQLYGGFSYPVAES